MGSPQTQGLSVEPRPTGIRWLVLVLACTISWLLYLHRYAWGVIKVRVADEFPQLSNEQLGHIDSAFNVAYALGQVPSGLAGDLLGPALVLPLILAAWSGALAATALGRGFWSFYALRLLFGATQAGAYPNLSKVTRSWFPIQSRTTMQGLIASFAGRAGGAFAPLIVATLLLETLGLSWRQVLIVIALVGVVFAVIFRILFRNTASEHSWTNAQEVQLIEADEGPASGDLPFTFNLQPLVLVSFGFLLFSIFTSAFADQLFVYWIPKFLIEEKGLKMTEMGLYASLPLFGGAIGGMFGGILNDRIIRATGRRQTARRIVGFSGKLLAAIIVGLSLMIEDGRWMMVAVAFGKFFTDWSQPTVWGAVTDISGPATGRVFGTVNMCGSFGAFFAGPILGRIIDQAGWTALFWTIAFIYVLSSLCWLGINTQRSLVVVKDRNGAA